MIPGTGFPSGKCVGEWCNKDTLFSLPNEMATYSIKIFQGRQPCVRRISGQYSSLQAALLILVIYYVGETFLNGEGSYSFV